VYTFGALWVCSVSKKPGAKGAFTSTGEQENIMGERVDCDREYSTER
jgi:hypothetical protein